MLYFNLGLQPCLKKSKLAVNNVQFSFSCKFNDAFAILPMQQLELPLIIKKKSKHRRVACA